MLFVRLLLPLLLLFAGASCMKKEGIDAPDTRLSIEGFSPVSGKAGTLVTIKGKNFGTLPAYNLVSVGSVNVVPQKGSSTELEIVMPGGLAVGQYTISVKVNGETVKTPTPFNLTGGGPFVSTDVVPITEQVVARCFDGTGMRDVHPRLLFTDVDIDRIKQLASSDALAKASYDDILSRANALLASPLLVYELDGANLRISNIHKFANDQVPYLVLAYQFTKDTKYAARCWQQLDLLCNYPDWGANRHFLDTGIAAKGVAIAYDGLYHYLTPAQRTQLVTALKTLALQPGKTQIETRTGVWRWYESTDNWNGICHGGLIMAALATYETDPTFNNQLIARATNNLLPFMQSFNPDGGSVEGMSYWSYGLSNTFLALESLKRCLSTNYSLPEQSGFRRTGWFPYLMAGPVGTATIGDDYLYLGKDKKMLSYNWFAYYFRDANLAKAHLEACRSVNAANTVKMNGWSDLLFYDPTLAAQGSAVAQPLDGYLKGIEYLYVQEKPDDENALYVSIHGGDNNANHGHLDAGSFYIQGLGETWALGNLGLESPYPADFFTSTSPTYAEAPSQRATTPGRWYYYRVRTEGKNCLVFNPDARPEQKPTGVATWVKSQSDGRGGYHILDLTDCYSRDVSAYRRGIKLNRSAGIITVQDEFTPRSDGSVYWLMHSPATDGLQISADGRRATMTKSGKTYHAALVSPANARFEKVDRSDTQINYLPETAPIFSGLMAGKNSPNRPFGKLQIKVAGLTANTATTIRVDFVKASDQPLLPTTSLSGWSTNN